MRPTTQKGVRGLILIQSIEAVIRPSAGSMGVHGADIRLNLQLRADK